MTAHGATAHLPASHMSTGLSVDDEVREYGKILKISEDIFSGTHPRLKVPQQFVRKPAPRDSIPNNHATRPVTSENLPDRRPTPVEKGNTSSSAKVPSGAPATPQSSRVGAKVPSEIDPIFLTKSEELVRAELQLQRGRVERTLREQLEQKRQESKQKVALQDARPDFDVSDVLHRALELARPSPSSDTHGPTKVPSDSFDDNSLYSSRAPDSPPSARRQRPSPPPVRPGNLAADAPVARHADELQRLEALNNSASDQEMQDTYAVAGRHVPYARRPLYKGEEDYSTNRLAETYQPADAFEEPEYSPPAPGVPPMERTDSREYQRAFADGPRQHEPGYQAPDRRRYGRRSQSPREARVVRNHITSPAAPRPSRVSPLATGNVPGQRFNEPQTGYDSDRVGPGEDVERGSPEAPAPAPRSLPRKRRRVQEGRDGSRRVSSRRQAVETSEPYIKQEPVSPPPFADDPPTVRNRGRQDGPVYIDIASPRYTPVVERREPAYETDIYEVPADAGIPRTVSRLSARRPVRDDQDLRRVASLQHARQPEYREYVEQPTQRSMQPTQRYYDEPAVPYTRRYIPADEPVSPNYREVYFDEDVSPRIMAPPPRRIVMDEQGNQYYEAIPAPRMSAMPPPYPRVPRNDIYDDQPPVRQQSVRAGSVVQDPYSGRRYMQEMPPPQPTYRRVTDYARPTPSERRPYAMPFEEHEGMARSSSVQVGEYPGRRTAFVEETEMPRERVMRMSSVRPPAVRYEEGREMMQPVEGVHPVSRAMSTYMDEEGRRGREYTVRPREERFW